MLKNLTVSKIIYFLLALSGLVSCCVLIFEAFHPVAIGDETFSLALAGHGYLDIIGYTARDVHPPVYYLILKLTIDILSLFSISAVSAGKIASVLPYAILIILSFTHIRKRFGPLAAFLFSLCSVGMAHMLDFGVTVRMYSWSMLFVTLAYLFFYDILIYRKKSSVIYFILFSLLASYTHYFACIAVMSLYLCLFFYFLYTERTVLKYWFLWVFITCILYLPWLIIAFGQVAVVSEDYWIEDITFDTLFGYFQFFFNPSIYRFHSGTLCGFILFLIILIFFIVSLSRRLKTGGRLNADTPSQDFIQFCFYPFAGLFVPFFEIAFGVAASLLIRPVLAERYLFVSVGAMWLAFSILASDNLPEKKPLQTIPFCGFLLFLICINTLGFAKREEEYRQGWRTFSRVLDENLQSGDVLLANFGQVRLCLSYTYSDYPVCYYWRQHTEDLFLELYPNLHDTRDVDTILSYLTDKNTIYYADAVELPEFHFQEDCTDEDITCEKLEMCLIENTPVNLYRISRKS